MVYERLKHVAASDFSLITVEMTDSADRAELSIFVRYIDSDSHEVHKQFLGLAGSLAVKEQKLCLIKLKVFFRKRTRS